MKNLQEFFLEQGITTIDWQGFYISVIRNPGLAMTAPGNEEFISGLLEQIRVITAESFGVELKNKASEGIRDHVVNVNSIAFLHDQDKIIGFASSKIFQEESIFDLAYEEAKRIKNINELVGEYKESLEKYTQK